MKFLSVIILIFRIKIALPQHWVSRHRRKALDGSLTPEETLFLESVRPLFDEEEWNEWMIDAALELPEADDEVRRAQTEKMLTDAKSLASAANAKVRKPLFRWSTRGIAACVAVFVLGFLYYIYNPHFVLDDFQRCRDVDPDAELALSSEPARLSYGTGAELEYTPFAMGHVPGDSVQQGHVVIRLVERGHYAISVQDQIDTLMAEHVEPSQRIRFETGAYQHIQVSLPDGTIVRMDAGSRLDYRMIFPDSAADLSQSREWIFLDGQALLKIPEHDAHSALVEPAPP